MRLPALDNLVTAKQLKVEPRNDAELGRMLAMARSRLADAHQVNEYEGYLEIEESGLDALRDMAALLIDEASFRIASRPEHP